MKNLPREREGLKRPQVLADGSRDVAQAETDQSERDQLWTAVETASVARANVPSCEKHPEHDFRHIGNVAQDHKPYIFRSDEGRGSQTIECDNRHPMEALARRDTLV